LSQEATRFLIWNVVGDESCLSSTRRSQDNIFRYPSDEPKVYIGIGSIHSVKGKEHTATLVLETYWHKHNLKALIPWITGNQKGWKKSDGIRLQTRLKVHYVAMTRPTHLLCLAMKRSTFESGGDLDKELVKSVEQRGWRILDTTVH
jgi:DNA helicase-2/ATP-dependent DNA helicase PcrA